MTVNLNLCRCPGRMVGVMKGLNENCRNQKIKKGCCWLWKVSRLKGVWSIQPYHGVKSSHILAGLSVLGLFISDSIMLSFFTWSVLLFLSSNYMVQICFPLLRGEAERGNRCDGLWGNFGLRPERIIFNLSRVSLLHHISLFLSVLSSRWLSECMLMRGEHLITMNSLKTKHYVNLRTAFLSLYTPL